MAQRWSSDQERDGRAGGGSDEDVKIFFGSVEVR